MFQRAGAPGQRGGADIARGPRDAVGGPVDRMGVAQRRQPRAWPCKMVLRVLRKRCEYLPDSVFAEFVYQRANTGHRVVGPAAPACFPAASRPSAIAARRLAKVTGLVVTASIPAALHSARLSDREPAVRPTIATRDPGCSAALIRRVAVSPSITGIITSISRTSYRF